MAKPQKPLIVGLTGQTGAGKTTVSEAFAEAGFAIINCDQVTRTVQQDPEILRQLAEVFGDILLEDGSLNRPALAAMAFSSPEQTQKLGGIMYPAIKAEIDRMVEDCLQKGQTRILLDAPTLFESGEDKRCQKRVAVLAPAEVRLQRIQKRDGITIEQAKARMSAQQKDSFYTLRSDYVLRNNGTREQLYQQGLTLAKSLSGQQQGRRMSQDLKTTITAVVLTLGTIFLIGGGYYLIHWMLYPRKYADLVNQEAQAAGVDTNLVYAIICCGSGFEPEATSDTGGQGLMLLTEETVSWAPEELGLSPEGDLLSPETNIHWGCTILSLLEEEHPDEEAVLAAWYVDDPAPEEKAEQVLRVRDIYENLYH